MTVRQKPILHGRDHGCGGADPIPNICLLSGPSETLEEIILADPGLAGFWKLNESSGDIAHDSSGNGWDMNSAAYAAPNWGQAAGPPGEQSAGFGIGLGEINTSFGALSGDLSLEVWAKRHTTADVQVLIGQGYSSAVNAAGVTLLIGSTTHFQTIKGALQIQIGDTTGGPHEIEGDTALAVGVWHHCALVRSAHVWTMYLDGVAQTHTYDDSGSNYNASSGIWLGHPPAAVDVCDADLSYAAAYDRALSAGEIGARYSAGTSGTTGGSKVLVSDGSGDSPHWAQVPGAALEDNAVSSGKIADGTIVDADVASAAAIAPTKLAHPGTTTTYLRGDGTWVAPPAGSVATDALFDAKGDLAAGTGSDTAARLAAGSNGQLLSADSTASTGLKWVAAPAGSSPAADTAVWMPLYDDDGVLVLDGDGGLIPTLIPIA